MDTFHQHSDFLVLHTLRNFKKFVAPYFEEVRQVDYIYSTIYSTIIITHPSKLLVYRSAYIMHVDLPQVSNKYSTYLMTDQPFVVRQAILMQPAPTLLELERDNMPHPSLVAGFLASIPGRVFAFIGGEQLTVIKAKTRPGIEATSFLPPHSSQPGMFSI